MHSIIGHDGATTIPTIPRFSPDVDGPEGRFPIRTRSQQLFTCRKTGLRLMGEITTIVAEESDWTSLPESLDPAWSVARTDDLVVATRTLLANAD